MNFESEGTNVRTEMKIRDEQEQSATKPKATEAAADSMGITMPKLESVYPQDRDDLLRKSAEKFNQKYLNKLMVLKPLRKRINISSRQKLAT